MIFKPGEERPMATFKQIVIKNHIYFLILNLEKKKDRVRLGPFLFETMP